jgi:hypothetical protein
VRNKAYLVGQGYSQVEGLDFGETFAHVARRGTDFLLVQIYMDNIIFGGSSHTLMSRFQAMMESEFQMSMMGELTFF